VHSEQKTCFFSFIFICQSYSSLSPSRLQLLHPHQHLIYQLILSTSPTNYSAIASFFFFHYTIISKNDVGRSFSSTSTTIRFHSFTDGPIPSVYDYKFVGDFFTDIISDGLRPSALPSSVIPQSVGISVRKTKKPFPNGFTDGICTPKKKDSRLKYTDGFLFHR